MLQSASEHAILVFKNFFKNFPGGGPPSRRLWHSLTHPQFGSLAMGLHILHPWNSRPDVICQTTDISEWVCSFLMKKNISFHILDLQEIIADEVTKNV